MSVCRYLHSSACAAAGSELTTLIMSDRSLSAPSSLPTTHNIQEISRSLTTEKLPSVYSYRYSTYPLHWICCCGWWCWWRRRADGDRSTSARSIALQHKTQKDHQFVSDKNTTYTVCLQVRTLLVVDARRLLMLVLASWQRSKTLRFPNSYDVIDTIFLYLQHIHTTHKDYQLITDKIYLVYIMLTGTYLRCRAAADAGGGELMTVEDVHLPG